MKQRLFRFAYHATRAVKSQPPLHLLRDADAFTELAAVLFAQPYEYGGPLISYQHRSIDLGELTPDDLIVLTTRPPLDDDRTDVHKASKRVDSPLEQKVIFDGLRPYFEVCARSLVILERSLATRLRPGYENRAWVSYRVHGESAVYKGLKSDANDLRRAQPPPPDDHTAAFFVRTPPLGGSLPSLLAAFAMSGTDELIWARILRTRYASMLTSPTPRFVMAEILLKDVPPRPVDLSFCDDLPVEIILDEEIDANVQFGATHAIDDKHRSLHRNPRVPDAL
jgi:hypothetical protein